jgi:type I restriction enzyme R subunit
VKGAHHSESDGYVGDGYVETMTELHFFDRKQDYTILERRLPHWGQAGVLCFITFRTADSMPEHVIRRWRSERANWLSDQGIDPYSLDWRQQLSSLDRELQDDFYRTFSAKWHHELDSGYGACVLRDAQFAKIVADSLQHGNGETYELTDFVVMPNHVHLLVAFQSDETMLKQCESWKRWTATRINRNLNQRGRFWQQDGFDHLMRSEQQHLHFRRYIADNPKKANLKAGEYYHWSK